jgi:hypothetical protein
MKSQNLFTKRQYGFIYVRSTSLQLLEVLDKWTEALDNGLNMALTIAVFQSDGSLPISSDCLNIWYSGFVMELDISLRTLGCSSGSRLVIAIEDSNSKCHIQERK